MTEAPERAGLADVGLCVRQLERGHKILICGNGGSAAEASHFAAELVVRYKLNRGPLPCMALNDPAILTACANDFGYQWVFSRQVLAYGKPGDVLIALSTSGKSQNVLNAIESAHMTNMHVLEAPRPKGDTAYIQARQLDWLHHLAECIEAAFVKPAATVKPPIQ